MIFANEFWCSCQGDLRSSVLLKHFTAYVLGAANVIGRINNTINTVLPPPQVAVEAAASVKTDDTGSNFPTVDVFTRGEGVYYCVKIPELLRLASGVLLAFGEARMFSCGDYTATDLVVKRSHTAGRTWEALQVVSSMSQNGTVANTVGNAAPVQLRGSGGRVLVPFCLNNSKSMFLTWSDSDGALWAPAVPLKGLTSRPDWNWIGLGPPGALQLRSGRILVPAYHSVNGVYPEDDNGDWSHGHVLLSDNNGSSFFLGATQFGSGAHYSNECQAVELRNGSVLIITRSISDPSWRPATWAHFLTMVCRGTLSPRPPPPSEPP